MNKLKIGDYMNIMKEINKKQCNCGKEHTFESEVIVGKGVINQLPQVLKKFNATKVFLIADENTFDAAGDKICKILASSGMKMLSHIYSDELLHPDETSVGSAIMHYKSDCDLILAVGSGVINDISKIVANVSGKPYIIVATAPSMDGYASATSSMTMDGLKISLDSKCADVIIGDTDILCNAPMKMMLSGLGDMLAKCVSICEWRISHLVNGEYYCEKVAQLVRSSLKKCVDNAEGLLRRDEIAVQSVFEGLIICGAAMKFAGMSRPASGVEHYLSHIWDMRGVAFGTATELHGIQCALGTLIAIKLYEKIRNISPNKQKAFEYAEDFKYCAWSEKLRNFLGKGAESMISLEEKEQKYDLEKHRARFQVIFDNWDNIKQIMEDELPSYEYLENLFQKLGMPTTMKEIGMDEKILSMTFKATKDIRDKYVLSRLAWDLGVIEDIIGEKI